MPVRRPGQRPRGTVITAAVPARLVDLDTTLPALRDLSRRGPGRARIGASVWAWRDAARLLNADSSDLAFAEPAARLPTAAHTVLNPDSTAISSASALLARFRQTATTRTEVRSAAIQAELRPVPSRRSGLATRTGHRGPWRSAGR
jgi:hypothetical protein